MSVVRLGFQGEEEAFFREGETTAICQQQTDRIVKQLVCFSTDNSCYFFNCVFHSFILV